MKVIKVVYSEKDKSILDVVQIYSASCVIEAYNINHHKQEKKGRPILTRHGTKNTPLIVFEDENLIEVAAIWSETNPDWDLAIADTLHRLKYE